MAIHVMKLPDVGEGVVDAEIVEWHVKVGDVVSEDQHIVDVMTDKATVEISAPVAGAVKETVGEPGDMVAVGSTLISFETESSAGESEPVETAADEPAEEAEPVGVSAAGQPPVQEAPESPVPTLVEAAPAVAAVAASSRADVRPAHRPLAAPTVRRRAREAHIDLADVPGTGRGGRISHQDLDHHIASGHQGGARPPAAAVIQSAAVPSVPISGDDRAEEIKLIGMRRVIAEKMAQSKRQIPHFAYVEEVDVTELERLRQHLNANRREDQAKLTYLPFIMVAMIRALRDFPQCNQRFDEERGVITRYGAVHCGVATQTANGLMVPVVRHADQRDIWACAAEIQRVSQAARQGQASREELTGSTITITSLGALGGIVSTPVINYPEVAIIGVNKSVERPMMVDGKIAARRMMNLSSSFDHRIVDGYDAARFIQRIREMLEFPATMWL